MVFECGEWRESERSSAAYNAETPCTAIWTFMFLPIRSTRRIFLDLYFFTPTWRLAITIPRNPRGLAA
jgi:hypothetical protein